MDILKSSGTCLPFATGAVSGCAFDATGTITVTDNGTPLDAGTFGVNSQGHGEDLPIQLLAGTHNLSATYSGDISYSAPAAATTLALTVTKAATSTVMQPPNPSSIASGGSVTLTAIVQTTSSGVGPTNTVQFKNGSATLGSAVNCVPTAASASAAASCTATLTTTLSLLPPLSAPNRIPTPPVLWIVLAVFALLLVLLLNLRRVPARYRRVYATAGLLLLVALATGLAVGCSSGYGGGGKTHYDSITAVYNGDSNYNGSTSTAVQVTVQ